MKKNGFTLMELLAVIAITAVLSVIAIPTILNLYNKSVKNAFQVQSQAVVKAIDDDISIDLDNIREYDCLNGNESIYKKCTVTVVNGKPVLEAEGTGKFSGYYIYDQSIEKDGHIINTNKLSNYNASSKEIKFSLIDDSTGGLSSNFKEESYSNIMNTLNSDDEIKDKFPLFTTMFTGENVTGSDKAMVLKSSSYVKDGKIYGGDATIFPYESTETTKEGLPVYTAPVYIASINLSNTESGTYEFKSSGIDGSYVFMVISKNKFIKALKNYSSEEEVLNNMEPLLSNSAIASSTNSPLNYMFGEYNVDDTKINASNPTLALDEADTYYVVVMLFDLFGSNPSTVGTLKQISMKSVGQTIGLSGDKTVTLLRSEVKDYKDPGLKSYNETLKENKNYIKYSDLKDKVGDYKISYVLKQDDKIKTFVRNVYVVSEKPDKYLEYYNLEKVTVNGMYILKGSTDKYKFYCSTNSSYLSETNKECPVKCGRFGHILIESTESSYIKYINFVGGSCYN